MRLRQHGFKIYTGLVLATGLVWFLKLSVGAHTDIVHIANMLTAVILLGVLWVPVWWTRLLVQMIRHMWTGKQAL